MTPSNNIVDNGILCRVTTKRHLGEKDQVVAGATKEKDTTDISSFHLLYAVGSYSSFVVDSSVEALETLSVLRLAQIDRRAFANTLDKDQNMGVVAPYFLNMPSSVVHLLQS